MHPSIFLKRTNEKFTYGITNIPLTYPAKVKFIIPLTEEKAILNTYTVLESMLDSMHIIYNEKDSSSIRILESVKELDSKTIKLINRNFHSLKPKFISDYRYLFWEIDTQDNEVMQTVLDVYRFLKLPVYVHKSMRGYHFLSVKPIKSDLWQFAITQLRHTNESYPPITLRITPNKYLGEDKVYCDGFIYTENYHADTERLRVWLNNQNISKLQEHYQIVYYPFEEIEK